MAKQNRYATDGFALKIVRALLEDLNLAGEYPMGHVRQWELQYTPLDPYAFKKHTQILELFKKYTFEQDVYTPKEVEALSIQKFKDCQARLATHSYEITPRLKDVVFRAKGWIDRVLADYDLDEHLEKCYLPRKASVGTTLRHATLEHRWLRGLTGSREHIEWFDRVYTPWHGHCASLFGRAASSEEQIPEVTEVHELHGTLVEKTYKSKRLIVPNTAIGGLYSNGLGEVLVSRLKRAGYDVRTLPGRHSKLARYASKTGRLATVDQSMASDNITPKLVEMLVPRRWARALSFGRLSKLRIGDDLIHCQTFSTMGIGFTFPLQMLIFLGLTHATCDLWEEEHGAVMDRTISAFGDDLICPVEIHTELEWVFESLGLVINRDKTFWSGPFRESCGSDYFRGYDVRPAYVPTGGALSKKAYEAYLYKTFNALVRRWDICEVPGTLNTIILELGRVREKPFVVPLHFGDDTGLKLDRYDAEHLGLRRLPKRNTHGVYVFPYLRQQPEYTEVRFHECYLWASLQRSSRASPPGRRPGDYVGSIFDACGVWRDSTPAFNEVEAEEQPGNYRSKLTGKRLKKRLTEVPLPGDHGRYESQQGQSITWS